MQQEIIKILKTENLDEDEKVKRLLGLFETRENPRERADPDLVRQTEELLGRRIDDCPTRSIVFEETPIYKLVNELSKITVGAVSVSCNLASKLSLRIAQVAQNDGYQKALRSRHS